ncbi:uncharacterized protein LOC107611223 [Arachis ipaensis]|uniref:uncharacterized protein LOC107611223 n=1 Tax=Arachis ipaensis TaxID=130454 RepID=UPI0007AF9A8D|nr:uncharacterized protein LOC107611223 [Arachis ipaensis]
MTIHAMWWTRQSSRNENEESAGDSLDGVPRTLAAFLKVDLPIFNGSTNPTEADNWFQAVERALQTQHVPYDQFVEYATYQLVGEAQQWWQGEHRLLHQQNMDITWTLFQEAFYKRYFHESIREAKKLKCLRLKQGSMTEAEYTSKFEELCRFLRISQGAPESYEGWKCIKYRVRLREDIMSVVAPLEIREFLKLMNKARDVEDCIQKMTLMRDTRGGTSSRGHGKYFPPRGQIFKREGHATQHPHGQRNLRRKNNVQFHQAKRNGRCYTFGLFGHIAKNCCRGKNQDASQNQQ